MSQATHSRLTNDAEDTERVTVRYDSRLIEKVDAAVEDGLFANRSQALRSIVDDWERDDE